MIVLCNNPDCGAVLRAADAPSPLTTVVLDEPAGRYFVCPRCERRTVLSAPRSVRRDEGPAEAPLST